MQIIDGLKLEGKIVEIPDVGRNDFAKFLHDDMDFKTGAEIGVDKGEYGKVLCDAGLEIYGVDPWENYNQYKREGRFKSNMEEAVERLKNCKYHIIKKYSQDALADFEDRSLDFVYIDANHTLPYVCADIFGWEKKVRNGGIISGHDYAIIRGDREHDPEPVYDGCHVKAAVDSCVNVMRVDKLYILGERFGKRDKWRSWFWIKSR